MDNVLAGNGYSRISVTLTTLNGLKFFIADRLFSKTGKGSVGTSSIDRDRDFVSVKAHGHPVE